MVRALAQMAGAMMRAAGWCGCAPFSSVYPKHKGGREEVADDISHEGLRVLLHEEGVSFQRLKTWETSKDEFGPPNLQPRPGRQWAAVTGKNKEPGRERRPAPPTRPRSASRSSATTSART